MGYFIICMPCSFYTNQGALQLFLQQQLRQGCKSPVQAIHKTPITEINLLKYITTTHDVIKGARIFNTKWSCHTLLVYQKHITRPDPFTKQTIGFTARQDPYTLILPRAVCIEEWQTLFAEPKENNPCGLHSFGSADYLFSELGSIYQAIKVSMGRMEWNFANMA